MRSQERTITCLVVIALVMSVLTGVWPSVALAGARGHPQVSGSTLAPEEVVAQDVAPAAAAAGETVVVSYAAKFVCTEPLQPGQFWYGLSAPIVQQKTDVLVHNPNGYPVTLYKKAVRSPVEKFGEIEQGAAPGKWNRVDLRPDFAFRIDCDDIAKLLTGDPAATSISAFGIGNTVEGFVVIGIGPQLIAGTNVRRQGLLDVTADYVRNSEFLKKDINFQPWWRYWWWTLPWQLGYAYQRVISVDPSKNIDCRAMLYEELKRDTQATFAGSPNLDPTMQALTNGSQLDPSNMDAINAETPPALVALVGRCDKVSTAQGLAMSVDYVVVSNRGPSDSAPGNAQVTQPTFSAGVRYPWIPGRWYDLALVTPQNLDIDIHDYFRTWQTQRWVTSASGSNKDEIQSAMSYWFPYWCGWGYWWWWWNGSDCVDIGVGDGESLDVEQVTPTRVLMPAWPPANQ